MVLPPFFSSKMGEIETVEAEKMEWLDLPRGTSYPLSPTHRRIARNIYDIIGSFIQYLSTGYDFDHSDRL